MKKMKREFARTIAKDIRRLQEARKNQDWDLYKWLLNRALSKNEMAYDLDIITFDKWKMLCDIVYA